MVQRITLMEAYLIEALKSEGIESEVIFKKAQSEKLHEFDEKFEGRFDFSVLYPLTEQLLSILAEGYQVKFLTFPGLQRLLEIKINKKADVDYTIDEFVINDLHLTNEDAEIVGKFLSDNWILESVNGNYSIQPK